MYHTRIVAALLVGQALLGCAPPDRNFTIDPASFNDEERGIVDAAARSWDPILEDPITTDGGSWRVVRGPVPKPMVAFTDEDTWTITVDPSVQDDMLYAVMLHEFGHSVGFQHHDGLGVMNPGITSLTFTDADLEECQHLRRCR